MNKKEFKNCSIKPVLKYLENWLAKKNIGKTLKKQKQIAREIFWVIYELGLTLDDITSIKKKIDKFPFKIQEGNFWTNLEKHFNDENLSNFFKFVIDIKPIGLNKSPNASCGKVELAFLLLLKDSKQPKVGDIQLEKTYELKGEDTRISSNWLTGQEYKILTEDIFKDLINPNLTRNGAGIESFAFEIEKSRHNRFYVTEFEKIKMEILIERFTKLFTLLKIEGNLNLLAKNIFKTGYYNQELYKHYLLKSFFEGYKNDKGFDAIILFGDDSNVKIIESANDLQKCNIGKDYFRIYQSKKIGWYIH